MRRAFFVLVFCAACGSTSSSFDGGTFDAGDASLSDGGNPHFGDAGEGGTGGTGCSGDLRSVIDSSGNVVMTCPPDQGCNAGKCVAACQAAAASKGSVGCDYVVSTPAFYYPDKPPCFAVFVANNWPKDVNVSVTRSGTTYDVTKFGRIAQSGQPVTSWAPVPSTGIPPGDVAVLFMSHDPSSVNFNSLACPIAPAISQANGTAVPGSSAGAQNVTARGAAFHLSSDVPVTMYDILPYGGATSYLPSAELILPTSAWGTNYLGIVPTRGNFGYPQWGQLVAMQDGTQVTILPNVTLPSGTNVSSAPANQQTVYSLNAGEFIQWEDSQEMSGTVIQSNNPVGFVGGNTTTATRRARRRAAVATRPTNRFRPSRPWVASMSSRRTRPACSPSIPRARNTASSARSRVRHSPTIRRSRGRLRRSSKVRSSTSRRRAASS